jgi:hypothetical protein
MKLFFMNMLKVKPHADYLTEDGRYLRGNDFSPMAVAIILNQDGDKWEKQWAYMEVRNL